MSDLSSLSNDELQALYQKGSSIDIRPVSNSGDLSSMSDADLIDAHKAASQGTLTNMAQDAVKSIGAGLGSAAIGTLGSLGDITNLGAKGIGAASNYISDKLGLDRYQPSQSSLLNYIPTSQSIRASVTDPIVSPDYQPQYPTGSVLKTGAEFLPAIAQGPGGLGRKFLTNVAAPALASEGAGALGRGTAAEPYLRVGGALLGGAGASRLSNAMAETRAIKNATPSFDSLKSGTSAGYDTLTAGNVIKPLAPGKLDSIVNDLKDTLNRKGIRPSNAAGIHNALEEVRAPATAGAPDVADLVAGRQSLKTLLSDPSTNKAGAFVALNKIEKEIEAASPGTMTKLNELDKNWAAVRANEALDKRLTRADLRAAGEHSGMNVGNKIRQQVTNYLLSNEAKYLSPETKAELEKIVRGTATQNVIRHVANLLGGGGGLGMLASGTAGYEAGGWPGAIAGAVTGRGLKMINNRAVINQAEKAAQGMRLRSPMGQQNPIMLPPMSNPMVTGLVPAFLARPKQ